MLYYYRGGDKVSDRNIGFKVEEDFYKKIKIEIAQQGITLKEYIVNLIKKDFENKK